MHIQKTFIAGTALALLTVTGCASLPSENQGPQVEVLTIDAPQQVAEKYVENAITNNDAKIIVLGSADSKALLDKNRKVNSAMILETSGDERQVFAKPNAKNKIMRKKYQKSKIDPRKARVCWRTKCKTVD